MKTHLARSTPLPHDDAQTEQGTDGHLWFIAECSLNFVLLETLLFKNEIPNHSGDAQQFGCLCCEKGNPHSWAF